MCAPTKDLVKIAVLAGAAYATGGISLGATATTATTAATTATTAASSSGMFSTIANVIKIGAPILGAAGNIYSGMIQSNMLKAKANFVDFSIGMDAEASALRKIQRARNMRATIESQKAKYGVSGITLEGTPTDILSETSAKFAEDQFIDDFNTSQKMYGKQISAGQLRTEAQAAVLGGVTTAATTLAMRGFSPSATPKPSIFTQIPMGTGETF
jgi:hypothetical protein